MFLFYITLGTKGVEVSMDVTNYNTLRAWLKREDLPLSQAAYDIDDAFKISQFQLNCLKSRHRPYIYLKTLNYTFYNIEEYDFCSFYPSIYQHLIFSVKTQSRRVKNVQATYKDLFSKANNCQPKQKKKILNIIYGLFHCEYSIFKNLKLAQLIRIIGAMTLKNLSRLHHDRVVYCCVDSLFLVQDKENQRVIDKFLLDYAIKLEITKRNVFKTITFKSKMGYQAETLDNILIRKGVDDTIKTDRYTGVKEIKGLGKIKNPSPNPVYEKKIFYPGKSTKALIYLFENYIRN
uniref:Divergent family B DNA polymerase n=1 Tax=Dikerogammarus haemobaphes virus 1 TaxID=2704946 RepID=A0A6G9HE07_9VIRU|nr:divergent family B DNA polymerase [Dikerogammarus haemobaphes virus 1]